MGLLKERSSYEILKYLIYIYFKLSTSSFRVKKIELCENSWKRFNLSQEEEQVENCKTLNAKK